MAAKVKSLKIVSKHCEECKGNCWRDDSKERQALVLKEFGVIPNKCVNGEGNVIHCPYHN